MKIAIIDDHPLVRQGLVSILATEDYEIIGEGTDVKNGINIIIEKEPDIALVDLKLGDECGLDVIRGCKEKTHSKFVILTSSAQQEDFLMAEKIGVDGYVLKEAFPDELLYAINLITRGRKYYDPGLLEYKMKEEDNGSNLNQLTPREQDVLQALGIGLTNEQIAKKLFITRHTVKKHISHILAKLELQDRTQAALYANNNKLIRVC